MSVSLCLAEDFRSFEDADIFGVGYLAVGNDYLNALGLYTYLNDTDGLIFIDYLRGKKSSVVLCQARDPSGEFDFIRVVVSGNGIVMQYEKDSVIIEDPVSCLFACYVWRNGC